MATQATKRIRRSPEASKLAILEAAERRLIKDGPDGVRVQRIAADLGMTDAALHYHFGNREALVKALMRFSAKRLVEDIGDALETWDVDRLDLHQLGALFRKSYAERGVARLVLSVLAGRRPRGAGMLRRLVLTVHEARATGQGERAPASAAHRHPVRHHVAERCPFVGADSWRGSAPQRRCPCRRRRRAALSRLGRHAARRASEPGLSRASLRGAVHQLKSMRAASLGSGSPSMTGLASSPCSPLL